MIINLLLNNTSTGQSSGSSINLTALIIAIVIICVVFCCVMPICVICLTVALCCTCRKYRKAQKQNEDETAEGTVPGRSVVRQELPALPVATNATVLLNGQESGLYDYIPYEPMNMDDNGAYNVDLPADTDRSGIKVQKNTAYADNEFSGSVAVKQNAAYADTGLASSVSVQQNTAYVDSELATVAVEENTAYNYGQPLPTPNVAYEKHDRAAVEEDNYYY